MPDIPGTKKKLNKKAVAIIAAGGIVGGGALLWYRKKSAAAASSAATTTGTDTSGYSTDPGAIDPDTGIPYAEEYGGAYGTTPSALGYYDPTTGQYIGTGVGVAGGSAGGTVTTVTSNAAWAQAAQAYLVNSGYDPATVATALGLYLIGAALTQDQYDIVTAAIGFEGYPPNQPPAPHLSSGGGGGGQTGGGGTGTGTGTGTGGGGGTTTATKVTVPITFGMSATNALNRLRAAGFAADTSPVRDPKNTYVSIGSSPKGGTKAARGSHVTVNVKLVKRG